jgi:sugar/nucleoside kinase (ribokinase family)
MTTRVQAGLDVLVSGYASIDTVYQASAPPRAGATSLLRGPVASSSRCGGCGPGAAIALARAGCRVGLITWLGDDPHGQTCLQTWADTGIEATGVVVAPGQASPRSLLFYDPDGGATCYYHPSGSAALRLTAAGRDGLANAGALVVTVGPATLTEELLAARRPDQPLAWNVKADAKAFPPDLRRRLAREANLICLNRDELGFVASALPGLTSLAAGADPSPPAPLPSGRREGSTERAIGAGHAPPLPCPTGEGVGGEGRPPQRDTSVKGRLQGSSGVALAAAIQRHSGGIVVVTAGAAGCHVVWPGGSADVPALPVQVADPTGAGDTFFGAFVAGWLRGVDVVEAAAAAAAYVATFLRERAEGEIDA